MEPKDPSSDFDKAAAAHADSHIEWLKAGELLKAENAELKKENAALKETVSFFKQLDDEAVPIIGTETSFTANGHTLANPVIAKELAAVICVGSGKTSTTTELVKALLSSHQLAQLLHDAIVGESYEREAVEEFVEHAILGYLNNGDSVSLAKLVATFPGGEEHIINVPEAERLDAAVHPDSILAYNGRSLDSHNPWHLKLSFENYLAAEQSDAASSAPPAHLGLSHPGVSTMTKKAAIQKEEAAPAVTPGNPNKGESIEASRNKVARAHIDCPGHEHAARVIGFIPRAPRDNPARSFAR